MNRQNTHATLFVLTRLDADGLRHIISGRNLPTLCKTEARGAQSLWSGPRAQLCPRCAQKYMRAVVEGQQR
jgi:hypothetical protein